MINDSILETVRIACELDRSDASFDDQLLGMINSEFFTFGDYGLGPYNFAISDDSTTWADYFTEVDYISAAEELMGLRVKKVFDPTTSSTVGGAIDSKISELEWRIVSYLDRRNSS